jgi:gliding motility-associated-like protein
MKSLLLSFLTSFFLLNFINAQNGSPTCEDALPFCTGSNIQFPAGTTGEAAEAGPDYGCLITTPNPAWYYMNINQAGTVQIFMVGSDNPQGTPTNDIDFICYGPFDSNTNICNQLTADNTVDCSYSIAATETVDIPNAQVGDFYLLLITNFSGDPCNISFSQTGGTGTAGCGPFNNGPLCEGDTLELSTLYSDQEYIFSWTGPNGFVSDEPNPIIPNVTTANAGQYVLTFSDLTQTFTDSTNVEISSTPFPVPFTVSGDSCTGGSLTLTPDSLFINATYNWTTPSGNVISANPLIINPLTANNDGVYNLSILINGCSSAFASENVNVYVATPPVIVGDNHTCFSETAELATTTQYESYQWSNNTFGSLAIVTPGSYTVTVQDSNGCVGSSQPFLVGNSTPTPFIDGYERFCKYDTIELFVNDTFTTYRWLYLNDTTSTADTLSWTGGTPDNDDVVVIVTDAFGCVGIDTLNAPYTELPTAGLAYVPNTAAVLLNTPINFTNTSTPGAGDTVATWFWVFNNPPADEDTVYIPSPTESFPDTGQVDVTIIVTTELGCKDTLTIPIEIIDKPYVPNVFSPNGDGKNDFFVIPFIDGYPENTVVVYSRWGKVVHEATNYKSDWNGDNVISGTYFYVVSAPTLSEPLKGTVTIIKE